MISYKPIIEAAIMTKTHENIFRILASIPDKTFAIYNLGCRTNQAEILQIVGSLQEKGFKPNQKKPGLILINTCAVTQKAMAESRRLAKQLKRNHPQAKVIPVGCGIQAGSRKFDFADSTINNEEKETLLSKSPSVYLKGDYHPFPSSGRFLLRIQSGCNYFCSYCLVPFLRRRISFLSPDEIVHRCQQAEKMGYQEVVLTGTNLSLFGPTKSNYLAKTLSLLLQKTKILRIGLGSINLEAITPEFVDLYEKDWGRGGQKRLNRYLHIPLQSGSNNILQKMGRPYRTDEYEARILSLSEKVPNIGIGTDLIVGFPGETEKDFEQTKKFVQKLPFSRLHIFRFDKRARTVAAKNENRWGKVNEKDKRRRSQILLSIGKQKKDSFRRKVAGKKFKTLFLGQKKRLWQGLTDNYLSVKIKSRKNLAGKVITVRLSN